jgi:hypothetical protein
MLQVSATVGEGGGVVAIEFTVDGDGVGAGEDGAEGEDSEDEDSEGALAT